MPPPRVSPPMPVVEMMPPVVASPCAAVTSLKRPQVVPPPAAAVRAASSTCTDCMRRQVGDERALGGAEARHAVPAAADGEVHAAARPRPAPRRRRRRRWRSGRSRPGARRSSRCRPAGPPRSPRRPGGSPGRSPGRPALPMPVSWLLLARSARTRGRARAQMAAPNLGPPAVGADTVQGPCHRSVTGVARELVGRGQRRRPNRSGAGRDPHRHHIGRVRRAGGHCEEGEEGPRCRSRPVPGSRPGTGRGRTAPSPCRRDRRAALRPPR